MRIDAHHHLWQLARGDYARWMRAAMELIGGLTSTQQAMVMGGSAAAFYRLRSTSGARLTRAKQSE